VNLLGLPRAALSSLLSSRGAASYRLAQLLRSLYSRPRAAAVSSLLQFSLAERASLAATHCIDRGAVSSEQRSADGTVKWLLSLPAPQQALAVETVFIPPAAGGGGGGDDSDEEEEEYGGGGTLCVSSQAGCSLACAFCHTGTQRLSGNLPAAAIVSQLLLASERLEAGAGGAPAAIRNVVFMGWVSRCTTTRVRATRSVS
jgi:23S rRNA (adenine2503-C2)-methyltransferase